MSCGLYRIVLNCFCRFELVHIASYLYSVVLLFYSCISVGVYECGWSLFLFVVVVVVVARIIIVLRQSIVLFWLVRRLLKLSVSDLCHTYQWCKSAEASFESGTLTICIDIYIYKFY